MQPPLLRPPTPQEYAVLAIACIVTLLVTGTVALVKAWRLSPEHHATVTYLVRVGGACFVLAAVIVFAFWLFRRLVG